MKTKVENKKRGRKSSQEIERQIIQAIKHMDELERLEESPLARLPSVRRLAATRYRSSIFPTAFALRLSLLEAVNDVREDLAGLHGYQRELRFLEAFVQGQTVTQISRELGLTREHVARTVQRRALGLVIKAFLSRASQGNEINPIDVQETAS